ncbi:MAG: PQQ-dependent sugar dehydrogenase [Microthrixaceae bacterium]
MAEALIGARSVRSHGESLMIGVVLAILGLVVGLTVTVGGLAGGAPTPSRLAADRDCAAGAAEPRIPRPPGLRLALHPVADIREPAAVAFDPREPTHGMIAERTGRIRRLVDGVVTEEVVLDLRRDTAHSGDGGLLGLAYDPNGPWLYVYRTARDRTDVVTAHRLAPSGTVASTEARVVIQVDRPRSEQHHGGALAFGPDRMLYVGFGDGGGLGDPRENAQDPSSLLGKILRIEPTPDGRRPYRVPPDNPFVGRPGWAPEIWVLGVRNPFRITLDGQTGDLWLGDVGQSCWEEIDRLSTGAHSAGGANLGWDRLEGDQPFEGGRLVGRGHAPAHTYSHQGGRCAVVAGPVVRGASLPSLEGWLLFADYCAGRLMALRADTTRHAPSVIDLGLPVERPVAIVTGPSGRPWVLSLDGAVYEVVPR